MYWQGGCDDINSRVTFFLNMTLLFIVFSQLQVYSVVQCRNNNNVAHTDNITMLAVSSTLLRNKTFQTNLFHKD